MDRANERANLMGAAAQQQVETQTAESPLPHDDGQIRKASKKKRHALSKGREKRRRAAQRVLQMRRNLGLKPSRRSTPSNLKAPMGETPREEADGRFELSVEHAEMIRVNLPVLLGHIKHIRDPRDPRKIKHSLTCLMLFGILHFVYQMSSRREANRKMTGAEFADKLKTFFPEFDSVPHADTLARLLKRIDPAEIEGAHIALINKLLKNKVFKKRILDGYLTIAIDGTQKMSSDRQWAEEQLQHEIGVDDKKSVRFSVYVVEANIVLPGLCLPLLSEFLTFDDGDPESDKQDCELKAFRRIVARLKQAMPKRGIRLVLDGLYPNGPTMRLCRDTGWDFMIVLKDKSLPSLWQDYEGLRSLNAHGTHKRSWRGREQHFEFINDIEYSYDSPAKRIKVHMVVCYEYWPFVNDDDEVDYMTSKHAWISSKPLSERNLHQRCNLSARGRWQIEEAILDEKHRGYTYEHVYSYDWNAMKAFHYLMRLSHLLNTLALASHGIATFVNRLGIKGFFEILTSTVAAMTFDAYRDRLDERMLRKRQLRLVT